MSIVYYGKEEITVDPLTTEERKWVERLQRTLEACPSRLELVTTGDADLYVVDKAGASRSALAGDAAVDDGVALASVSGKPIVHGVSG